MGRAVQLLVWKHAPGSGAAAERGGAGLAWPGRGQQHRSAEADRRAAFRPLCRLLHPFQPLLTTGSDVGMVLSATPLAAWLLPAVLFMRAQSSSWASGLWCELHPLGELEPSALVLQAVGMRGIWPPHLLIMA